MLRGIARCFPTALVLLGLGALPPHPPRVAAAGTMLLRYRWVAGAHFRQTERDTETLHVRTTPAAAGDGTHLIVYHVTTTQRVTKVYPDGSGLVRSTFRAVTTSVDGKEAAYALGGVAIDQRIDTRGVVLSQKTIGAFPPHATLPSEVTDPTPMFYPAGPVGVGSTWRWIVPVTGPSLGFTGIYIFTLRVLAFGSLRGRPTITIGVRQHQPIHTTVSGITISGLDAGAGTEPIVVATGAPSAPAHLTFTLRDTIAGKYKGKEVRETIDGTEHEVITAGS